MRIAADSSSLVAFFAGETGKDINLLKQSIIHEALVLPPATLAELLSAPTLSTELRKEMLQLPLLETKINFWQRAGDLRRNVLKAGYKARLADTFIAQSCIDHGVPLITRDNDFRHYAAHGELILAE